MDDWSWVTQGSAAFMTLVSAYVATLVVRVLYLPKDIASVPFRLGVMFFFYAVVLATSWCWHAS